MRIVKARPSVPWTLLGKECSPRVPFLLFFVLLTAPFAPGQDKQPSAREVIAAIQQHVGFLGKRKPSTLSRQAILTRLSPESP